jgi:hypothetical protein
MAPAAALIHASGLSGCRPAPEAPEGVAGALDAGFAAADRHGWARAWIVAQPAQVREAVERLIAQVMTGADNYAAAAAEAEHATEDPAPVVVAAVAREVFEAAVCSLIVGLLGGAPPPAE